MFFPSLHSLYVPYFLRVWTLFPKMKIILQTAITMFGGMLNYLQKNKNKTKQKKKKKGYSYDIFMEKILGLVMTMISFLFTGLCAINYLENWNDIKLSMFDSLYGYFYISISFVFLYFLYLYIFIHTRRSQ